jgi:hypothetical protein
MFKYEVGQKVKTTTGEISVILGTFDSEEGPMYLLNLPASEGTVDIWIYEDQLTLVE